MVQIAVNFCLFLVRKSEKTNKQANDNNKNGLGKSMEKVLNFASLILCEPC